MTTPIGSKKLITAHQFNTLASNFATYWHDNNPNIEWCSLSPENKNEHSHGWGQNPVVLWHPSHTQQSIVLTKNKVGFSPTTFEELHEDEEVILPDANRDGDLNTIPDWQDEKIISVEGLKTGDYIYAEQTNTLISQFNASELHSSLQNLPNYIPKYDTGAIIYAATYDFLQNYLLQLENKRFDLNPFTSDLMMDPTDLAIEETVNAIWYETGEIITAATWPTYQDARYFFNSGGEIIFDLSGRGGSYRGRAWQNTFDVVGDIIFKANKTTNTGSGVSSQISLGLYDLDPQCSTGPEYKQLAVWRVDRGSANLGEYGWGEYANEHTDYGVGEYDAATVSIWAKAIESESGEFTVYFKIVLSENQDLDNRVDLEVTLTTGYKLPDDAPIDDVFVNGPEADRFIENEQNYQFERRTPPILSLDTSWIFT